MDDSLPLFPVAASRGAVEVDRLTLFLTIVSVFFGGLIFVLISVFAARYRRRHSGQRAVDVRARWTLEAAWIGIPLGLSLIMFGWGASLFHRMQRAPAGALEVMVVGRQWMWKLQHAGGPSEINELHVPTGRPVKLTLTSEDVIHSFFVPAFRLKMDAVPGRATSAWFEATRPGTYRLFCAEYCGTQHAGMIGRVVVMPPADYGRWLAGGGSGAGPAAAGARLFVNLGCAGCHAAGARSRGPSLERLLDRPVALRDGRTLTADEGYVIESILDPAAKVVQGWEPIMPSFRGQLGEEDLMKLIAYLRDPVPAGEEARR